MLSQQGVYRLTDDNGGHGMVVYNVGIPLEIVVRLAARSMMRYAKQPASSNWTVRFDRSRHGILHRVDTEPSAR